MVVMLMLHPRNKYSQSLHYSRDIEAAQILERGAGHSSYYLQSGREKITVRETGPSLHAEKSTGFFVYLLTGSIWNMNISHSGMSCGASALALCEGLCLPGCSLRLVCLPRAIVHFASFAFDVLFLSQFQLMRYGCHDFVAGCGGHRY